MAFPRIRVDEAAEAVVDCYCRYELTERRLCQLTVTNGAYGVRHYLAWRATTERPPLERLEADELFDYVLEEAGRLSIGAMRAKVSTLRAFARFLFVTGVTTSDLAGSIPSVSGTRFDGLPKALDAATVQALLATCNPARRSGRRDYAILLLMGRLGMRAVEVSRMQLEDIDWRSGVFDVRGKSGRRARLPLPADVGEALADYLALARRATASRAVFLQAADPPVGMSRNAVVYVSRMASSRAGIAVVGAHRLRHTVGTELLRHGASLKEVGEVLRQSDDMTTSIYAKVDQQALSLAVRPWPVR